MCLWYMRMGSIYNGAQGHPGGDESFANGQYCIYTKRSGSTDMNFPEVVCPPFRGQNPRLGWDIRRRVPGRLSSSAWPTGGGGTIPGLQGHPSIRRESWKSNIFVQHGGAWCQTEEGVIESSLGRERESGSSCVVFFFCKYPVWIQCLIRACWGWKYSPWPNKHSIWAFSIAVQKRTVIVI